MYSRALNYAYEWALKAQGAVEDHEPHQVVDKSRNMAVMWATVAQAAAYEEPEEDSAAPIGPGQMSVVHATRYPGIL
jgi:hypothetical protein